MNLDSTLDLLEVAGLLRRTGSREFMFRHTLLRDTAYLSLLKEERRELHRQVGQALERHARNGSSEMASVLAHHFLEGDRPDKAFEYLCRAGDEAARVYALEEALNHYGKALKLAGKGHGNPDDLIYLFERRGRMLELAGRYQEAIENYRELEGTGERNSNPTQELRGLVRRATLYSIPSAVMDQTIGRQLSERAMEAAARLGDRQMESLAHWNLMRVYEFGFELNEARKHGEKALGLIDGLDLPEQRAFILNDLVGTYLSTAEFETAVEVNALASELWLDLDNQPMLVDSYCQEIALGLFRGDYGRASEYSRKAIEISEEIGNTWGQSYARYMMYWIHAEQGHLALALATARQSIELAELAGFIVPLFQTRADLGYLHAYLGEFEKAHVLLDEASEQAQQPFPSWEIYPKSIRLMALIWEGRLDEAQAQFEGMKRLDRAITLEEFNYVGFILGVVLPEYLLEVGDWERALAESERFLNVFEHFQLEFLKSDLMLIRGTALLRLGRLDEARISLQDGLRQAEKVGSRRSLWKLHDALAAVAAESNDTEIATKHTEAAGEIIAYIADHTESKVQRKAFLEHAARRSLVRQSRRE